ncbi:MAG: NEW3 domain-containing protein [Chloroflexi bacterium]|nr:NEW3 domain-containing protein [Chloroflexota bacterium]
MATLATAAALALGVAAPASFAATSGGLTITTSYPAVVVAPGASVSFDVNVSTTTAQRVALSLSGAPDAWEAELHGGGFVIDAVETNGTDPTEIRVDLKVPTDASGTTTMTLTGQAAGDTVELVLQVRVDEAATGALSIRNDIAALRGPSTQTFSFSLTVVNDTTEDQTYSATGAGPTGWTVNTTLTGQSQAASAVVKANSTAGVTVAVEPPEDVDAGTYGIQVATSVGGQTLVNDLTVEITGSYSLVVATVEGAPLNGRGAAGSATPFTFTVTNTGTAAVTNVRLTGTAPTGWEVTFDKETVDSIDAGATETISAQIKPSGSAIAGDYVVTLTAAGDQSTRDSIEIRYAVETSIAWGIVGVALIVAVIGGVWWVFQRYGRR